jgi:hypothetical protein
MKEKEMKQFPKEIDPVQLLERYWQCKTSLDEERCLQTFFLGDTVPESLKIYRALFVRTHKQAEIKASKELIARINKPFRLQFYPFLKTAASILLLLTVGTGFFTHYQQKKQMDRLFSDTYTNPEDAVKKTEQVVAKVSSVLQLVQEKNNRNEATDSLHIKELIPIPSNNTELHE